MSNKCRLQSSWPTIYGMCENRTRGRNNSITTMNITNNHPILSFELDKLIKDISDITTTTTTNKYVYLFYVKVNVLFSILRSGCNFKSPIQKMRSSLETIGTKLMPSSEFNHGRLHGSTSWLTYKSSSLYHAAINNLDHKLTTPCWIYPWERQTINTLYIRDTLQVIINSVTHNWQTYEQELSHRPTILYQILIKSGIRTTCI